MSVSYKFILDQRRVKKDGTYPLKLRIYSGSQYSETSLKICMVESDWDEAAQQVKPSNPLAKVYNAKITGEKLRLEKKILLSDDDKDWSAASLLQSVKAPEPKKSPSFIKYGEKLAHSLKVSGRVGNAIVYTCAINKLKAFIKRKELPFDEVNYRLLTDFNTSLSVEGIKVNSISNYLRTIRAIYNQAIKEGIVSAEKYPFKGFKIRNEKTPSRSLTLDEFQAIIDLPLEKDSPMWHWRNYFLLSFYLIGINFADLLTLSSENIVDGRVVFRRKKTAKIYSIKIHSPAAEILMRYKGRNRVDQKLLLPVLRQIKDPVRLKSDVNQARKTCNEYLQRIANKCGIDKNITTYYARYTWANVARSQDYSKDMIAQALGHEEGNKVTSIYLDDYDSSLIDEMNEKVTGLVCGKKKGVM